MSAHQHGNRSSHLASFAFRMRIQIGAVSLFQELY